MRTTKFSFFTFLLLLFGFGLMGNSQPKGHQVKSGETLSSIAKKYHTTVAELIRLNPESKNGLKAGATLNIEESVPPKKTESTSQSSESGQATHIVKSGESLYKIAKKYKVSVTDLEAWNGITNVDLKVGQALVVSGTGESKPTTKPQPVEKSKPEPVKEPSNEESFMIHKVTKGETLSSIAKKANVTVEEIKVLNRLKNNNVNLGQDLKIPASSNTQAPVTKIQEAPVVPTTKQEKEVVSAPKESKPSPVATTIVSQEKPTIPETAAPPAEIPALIDEKAKAGIREVNNTLGYTRVVETGFAEAIEGDINSKKHLCLHKTAPIGSILQVKNEMNGQSVFVKVIGKLPETGSNEKLIIRISKQAYEKLLAAGKRFPVEVSYPEAQ